MGTCSPKLRNQPRAFWCHRVFNSVPRVELLNDLILPSSVFPLRRRSVWPDMAAPSLSGLATCGLFAPRISSRLTFARAEGQAPILAQFIPTVCGPRPAVPPHQLACFARRKQKLLHQFRRAFRRAGDGIRFFLGSYGRQVPWSCWKWTGHRDFVTAPDATPDSSGRPSSLQQPRSGVVANFDLLPAGALI